MKISWKQLGQAALIASVIAMSLALIFFVYRAVRVDASRMVQPSAPDSCLLQESKPVLIIALNGAGAATLCSKIIASSNGRYFTYYGAPDWQYTVMCAVSIKKVQYTVYDTVPQGATPTTRYSMSRVCSLLQQRHRLIGEGF